MFRVGLDTSALDGGFKNHSMRGIGRYVQELNRYFQSPRSQEVSVGTFDHAILHQPSLASSIIAAMPAGRKTLSQQLLYPLRMANGPLKEFDVVHFTAHMDAPAWSPKKYILTVHDLIPLVLKDMYKADKPTWRFAFARFLDIRAIKNASLIIAISENTANDLTRVLGIPRERMVISYLGVDSKFYDAALTEPRGGFCARFGIPSERPVVLYVGGIDQRKNFTGLIDSFERLLQISRETAKPEPVLVMAGNIQSDAQFPKLDALVKARGLTRDVIMPGFVDDKDLLQMYALSSVFFFPSLYEGFGLPPLEAMAAGTPVVSSNRSCMPEVLGDAVLMVDPSDTQQCAQQLYRVLHETGLAQSLRERGKVQARKFTWNAMGEQTLKAYERLARARG
ncbi:MAG: glycosyltransferase family 4 protein [Deltaproteobacteria bacterium]|nr:glycosyltransferase family 4 protein [Deltaproteobacteria bacterium]